MSRTIHACLVAGLVLFANMVSAQQQERFDAEKLGMFVMVGKVQLIEAMGDLQKVALKPTRRYRLEEWQQKCIQDYVATLNKLIYRLVTETDHLPDSVTYERIRRKEPDKAEKIADEVAPAIRSVIEGIGENEKTQRKCLFGHE